VTSRERGYSDRLGLRHDGVTTQAVQDLYGNRFMPDYPQCLLKMSRFRGTKITGDILAELPVTATSRVPRRASARQGASRRAEWSSVSNRLSVTHTHLGLDRCLRPVLYSPAAGNLAARRR
jgi:hypothetical protein